MSVKERGWKEQSQGTGPTGTLVLRGWARKRNLQGDSGGLGGQGTSNNAASWKPRGFSGKGVIDCVKGCEKVKSYEN